MYGAKKIQRSAFSGMKSSFVGSARDRRRSVAAVPMVQPHRTKPRLHERGDLSFEVGGVRNPQRDESNHQSDLDQRPIKLTVSSPELQQKIVQYIYRGRAASEIDLSLKQYQAFR